MVQFWQKKESGNAGESIPCSVQVQQRPGNSAVCAGGRRLLLARTEGSVPDGAVLLLLVSIGVSSAASRSRSLERFVRLQEQFSLVCRQVLQMSSRDAAPVVSVLLFLLLSLGPSVSAMATTDTGRTDGWKGDGLEPLNIYIYNYV